LSADPDAAAAVLVRASRDGDRSAFGRLYALYSRMVHAIAIARVGPADADDIVQDVFLTAMKQLHALRDESAFGGWLAAIARNRANGHHRSAVDTVELDELSDAHRVGAHQEEEREAHHALATIRGLPPAYRETLMMRLVEGMTGPEIAARTGLTPDSVRVNLHRGMKLLREALEGGAR
jgi:RNA polymerase sigma-70 factor, ECF subfamily